MNPNPKPLELNGKTLEGGGQLVRNALVLSAITGQEIIINNIRGNRQGKTGLKNSHVAAVLFLADVSGSEVSGAEVGSRSLRFSPVRSMDGVVGERREEEEEEGSGYEYGISLPTAGSVFLVFQAVYPYLMLAALKKGHTTTTDMDSTIRLHLRGGTNVSFSPSYDFIAQVLIPNFERLGLPRLAVKLHRRGWSTGPTRLGEVTMFISSSSSSRRKQNIQDDENGKEETKSRIMNPFPHPHCFYNYFHHFPVINLNSYDRGMVTRIDITVLAPDYPVKTTATTATDQNQNKNNNHDPNVTIRSLIETETQKTLRRKLRTLPSSTFFRVHRDHHGATTVPIHIHTSEPTTHLSHVYLLLVAHTTTGFRVSRDNLLGAQNASNNNNNNNNRRSRRQGRTKGNNNNNNNDVLESTTRRLVEQCVDSFTEELFDNRFDNVNININPPDTTTSKSKDREGETRKKRKPCVDVFMRDQIVLFEALGRMMMMMHQGDGNECSDDGDDMVDVNREDERCWSLHTRTAMWVCGQVLGVSF